jgi:hypothetical protein
MAVNEDPNCKMQKDLVKEMALFAKRIKRTRLHELQRRDSKMVLAKDGFRFSQKKGWFSFVLSLFFLVVL